MLEAATLTEQILHAVFEVSNTLGVGFLEAVYHRALLHELTASGLAVNSQVPFPVHYKGLQVGDYLKASGLQVAFLINFKRPRVEWKRLVRTL